MEQSTLDKLIVTQLVKRPRFTPIKTTGKIILLYILSVWRGEGKIKDPEHNGSKHYRV